MKKKSAAKDNVAKILHSEIVFQGKVFSVRRDDVIEPSGVHATRDVIAHPGSVVVLPVLADGRIVLVRQYRHATGRYLWELVAGRKEPHETPKAGAARELLEETGYRAKKLSVFLEFWPTPGFLEEKMFLLLANGLTAGEAQPEEDEKLSVRAFRPQELKQMIRSKKLQDAKSIAGLLYYFAFLK